MCKLVNSIYCSRPRKMRWTKVPWNLEEEFKIPKLSCRNRRWRVAYSGDLDWKEVYNQAIVVAFATCYLRARKPQKTVCLLNNMLSPHLHLFWIFFSITSSTFFTGIRSKESKVLQRSENHLEGCPCCDPFLSKVRKILREDVICVSTCVPLVLRYSMVENPHVRT